MTIEFFKYQGAGNDFVMIDYRNQNYELSSDQVAFLCHRRFGVGADGLILLKDSNDCDFEMIYYNSDGNLSSMCGNGGRCIVAFAHYLGVIHEECEFDAVDGKHKAHILKDGNIRLQMQNVGEIIDNEHQLFLNTGSPHHIEFISNVDSIDVNLEGAKIRNSQLYGKEGSNVNFVECNSKAIKMRTYERGVEAETLACGTGVTAAALAANYKGLISSTSIPVQAKGGELKVEFKKDDVNLYYDIWLSGPATLVFQGKITC